MARPKLRSAGQPPLVRFLLGLYEAAASLKLAVVVIAASAVVLGWATFVDKWYGEEPVAFGIYRSWWFALLLGLLGLNVLCAALIRYPWKKYQVGFLVTHAGILVLLAGCLVQRVAGVDAQMIVVEADASHKAFATAKHFRLLVWPADAKPDAKPEEINVPFRSGPFNWEDYSQRFFFPWRLAPRDQGVIYDRDGITLEVLDYYADSRRVFLPRIELEVGPGAGPLAAMGPGDAHQRIELEVSRDLRTPAPERRPFGRGSRSKTNWGPAVTFWMTGEKAETEAFLDSRPQGPLGTLGQVVLRAGGKNHYLSVDELREKGPMPLGQTGIEVRLARINPHPWGLLLEIRPKDKPRRLMLLLAHLPNASVQDYRDGVFGTYWFQPPEIPEGVEPGGPHAEMMRHGRAPRLDVLLGHDQRLYYRQWVAPEVTQTGPWPTGGQRPDQVVGTKLVAFEKTATPVALTIEELEGGTEPAVRIEPRPFVKKKKKKGVSRQPRARVRLTVDGNSGEFWLPVWYPPSGPPREEQQGVVVGEDRRVEMVITYDAVDLGFQIYLHDFTRKLDPGSRMESHFSSLVDVLEWKESPKNVQEKVPPKKVQEKILITMNEPLTVTDPKTGRAYRFYQADYDLVGKPGDRDFDAHVYFRPKQLYEPVQRDNLYYSVLSVNYDPGRGIKYTGCLLVVAGIVTVFYMRAYLFRRRRSAAGEASAKPATH